MDRCARAGLQLQHCLTTSDLGTVQQPPRKRMCKSGCSRCAPASRMAISAPLIALHIISSSMLPR